MNKLFFVLVCKLHLSIKCDINNYLNEHPYFVSIEYCIY